MAANFVDCVNNDFSNLKLKIDHSNRPIYVCGDGHLFLETTSPFFKYAYDFCIAISEPISRPKFIHEFKITPYSLYAAVSVGLTKTEILSNLNKFSKTEVSPALCTRIAEEISKCGKIKLVLRGGKYFLESVSAEILRYLINSTAIKAYAVKSIESDYTENAKNAIEINSEFIEPVKKICRDEGFPSLEEYEFLSWESAKMQLDIKIKPDVEIRPYQKKSLGRMLGNGRARSGIIVLPCGAGKTLVGISAICTVKKSAIIIGTTGVACQQWKNEFFKWTDVSRGDRGRIKLFISSTKELISDDAPCVVITTYSMIAYSQKRSKEAQSMMDQIRGREWGLVVLDEVHVAPADMFRKCLSVIKSKCKLGLTATLVREDEKIEDLFFLVGPKLYEADWLGLQRKRYLATVKCIEVWCPMPTSFLKEYLNQKSTNRKNLLSTMNPVKFRNCQKLISYHEKRGDKILVFSDNIYSLQKYAVLLEKPFIFGKTSETERLLTLDALQNNPRMNTLFISRIGDCSIDLPDVNVIIQISSHFSSRRQEAQRLGRILRPKSKGDARAFFYSLVSLDTDEYGYAAKRQRFLIDQGYSFEVRKDLTAGASAEAGNSVETGNSFGAGEERPLMFSGEAEVAALLREVMSVSEAMGSMESGGEDGDEQQRRKGVKGKRGAGAAPRKRKLKSSKVRKVAEKLTLERKRKERFFELGGINGKR